MLRYLILPWACSGFTLSTQTRRRGCFGVTCPLDQLSIPERSKINSFYVDTALMCNGGNMSPCNWLMQRYLPLSLHKFLPCFGQKVEGVDLETCNSWTPPLVHPQKKNCSISDSCRGRSSLVEFIDPKESQLAQNLMAYPSVDHKSYESICSAQVAPEIKLPPKNEKRFKHSDFSDCCGGRLYDSCQKTVHLPKGVPQVGESSEKLQSLCITTSGRVCLGECEAINREKTESCDPAFSLESCPTNQCLFVESPWIWEEDSVIRVNFNEELVKISYENVYSPMQDTPLSFSFQLYFLDGLSVIKVPPGFASSLGFKLGFQPADSSRTCKANAFEDYAWMRNGIFSTRPFSMICPRRIEECASEFSKSLLADATLETCSLTRFAESSLNDCALFSGKWNKGNCETSTPCRISRKDFNLHAECELHKKTVVLKNLLEIEADGENHSEMSNFYKLIRAYAMRSFSLDQIRRLTSHESKGLKLIPGVKDFLFNSLKQGFPFKNLYVLARQAVYTLGYLNADPKQINREALETQSNDIMEKASFPALYKFNKKQAPEANALARTVKSIVPLGIKDSAIIAEDLVTINDVKSEKLDKLTDDLETVTETLNEINHQSTPAVTEISTTSSKPIEQDLKAEEEQLMPIETPVPPEEGAPKLDAKEKKDPEEVLEAGAPEPDDLPIDDEALGKASQEQTSKDVTSENNEAEPEESLGTPDEPEETPVEDPINSLATPKNEITIVDETETNASKVDLALDAPAEKDKNLNDNATEEIEPGEKKAEAEVAQKTKVEHQENFEQTLVTHRGGIPPLNEMGNPTIQEESPGEKTIAGDAEHVGQPAAVGEDIDVKSLKEKVSPGLDNSGANPSVTEGLTPENTEIEGEENTPEKKPAVSLSKAETLIPSVDINETTDEKVNELAVAEKEEKAKANPDQTNEKTPIPGVRDGLKADSPEANPLDHESPLLEELKSTEGNTSEANSSTTRISPVDEAVEDIKKADAILEGAEDLGKSPEQKAKEGEALEDIKKPDAILEGAENLEKSPEQKAIEDLVADTESPKPEKTLEISEDLEKPPEQKDKEGPGTGKAIPKPDKALEISEDLEKFPEQKDKASPKPEKALEISEDLEKSSEQKAIEDLVADVETKTLQKAMPEATPNVSHNVIGAEPANGPEQGKAANGKAPVTQRSEKTGGIKSDEAKSKGSKDQTEAPDSDDLKSEANETKKLEEIFEKEAAASPELVSDTETLVDEKGNLVSSPAPKSAALEGEKEKPSTEAGSVDKIGSKTQPEKSDPGKGEETNLLSNLTVELAGGKSVSESSSRPVLNSGEPTIELGAEPENSEGGQWGYVLFGFMLIACIGGALFLALKPQARIPRNDIENPQAEYDEEDYDEEDERDVDE